MDESSGSRELVLRGRRISEADIGGVCQLTQAHPGQPHASVTPCDEESGFAATSEGAGLSRGLSGLEARGTLVWGQKEDER